MSSSPHQFDIQARSSWRRLWFQSIARRIARVREARRARREIRSLHDLSDRLLDDIGLSRADLLEDRALTKAAEWRRNIQG